MNSAFCLGNLNRIHAQSITVLTIRCLPASPPPWSSLLSGVHQSQKAQVFTPTEHKGCREKEKEAVRWMKRWVILRSVYKPFLSLKFGCLTVYSLRHSRQHPESWGLPRHFQVFQLNSYLSTVLLNAAVFLDVSAFP